MGTTTEKLTYLQGTKDTIKNAIVAKGVEVPEGTTFRGYAEKIGEIQAGGGILNATITLENEVSKGANIEIVFVDATGNKINMSGTETKIVNVKNGEPIVLIAEYLEITDLAIKIDGIKFGTKNLERITNTYKRVGAIPITKEKIKIGFYYNV